MSNFNVGDRIRVITKRWDRSNFIQYHKTGTICTIEDAHIEAAHISVVLDEPEPGSGIYSYCLRDIEHLGPEPLDDQEYHDVFAGQEIYNGLRER